jgi:hypothetical protein
MLGLERLELRNPGLEIGELGALGFDGRRFSGHARVQRAGFLVV